MIRHISSRGFGFLMFLGGLFLLWLSTLQPYWSAVDGSVGTRIYTGSSLKGTFFSPFLMVCGLALMIGGEKARAMIEGEHRFGKGFWIGLVTIGLIAGGLNTWWFKSQMAALHMRRDYTGHMIKGQTPMFSSHAEAMAHFEAEPSIPRAKIEMGVSEEAWDAMNPEMQASIRNDFPSMVPVSERKTGS